MALKDLMGKAGNLVESATDTANKVLDEFNEALPTMRALGFTVKDVRVGMGLMPEIGAKLIASADTIDVKKIGELIEKKAEKKMLVTALKTLETAYNIKQTIGDLSLKGVELDFTLKLPPNISVSFVGSTTSVASAGAAAPHQ